MCGRYEINEGVKKYGGDENAVLVDVRGGDEYAQGHIPGSVNVPLNSLYDIGEYAPETDAHVYVYCQSGRRSCQAAAVLMQMGYENVSDIGGIEKYRGSLEK